MTSIRARSEASIQDINLYFFFLHISFNLLVIIAKHETLIRLYLFACTRLNFLLPLKGVY